MIIRMQEMLFIRMQEMLLTVRCVLIDTLALMLTKPGKIFMFSLIVLVLIETCVFTEDKLRHIFFSIIKIIMVLLVIIAGMVLAMAGIINFLCRINDIYNNTIFIITGILIIGQYTLLDVLTNKDITEFLWIDLKINNSSGKNLENGINDI